LGEDLTQRARRRSAEGATGFAVRKQVIRARKGKKERQQQKKKQIPRGNDNKRGKSKGKDKCRSLRFAAG
jgi:hypothetical protein